MERVMTERPWPPGEFLVAVQNYSYSVTGYVWRGLGLHVAIMPSPKGGRPARWCLTHLGTGHRICFIDGDVATAFPIATEIAEAGDWDFLSFTGYKDRFPDAPERLSEILARYPKNTQRGDGSKHNIEAAQICAASRP